MRFNNQTLVALPPDYVDYFVTVTGKICIQTDGGYRQIGVTRVPANSKLLLWTTSVDYRSQTPVLGRH